MFSKVLKKIDYLILIIVGILFSIGAVALNSASQGAGGDPEEFTKQLMWFGVGFVFLLIVTFFDYHHLKKLCIPTYIILTLLLVGVLFSSRNNGATSWFKIGFMSFQPSEFMKLSIIICIANIISYYSENNSLNKIKHLIIIGIVTAIPVALILIEPDYGTAIVLLFIVAAMLFTGGISYKYIILVAIILAGAFPIVYQNLPAHAKSRIEVFLNPESDPRGAGYNIIQSKLAIGSGMLTGTGLYEGNQTQQGILPMKTTDFIFSVISEEMGFVISAFVIVLFCILLFRIILIAKSSRDVYGRLICVGVFAMIFVHFIENVGMSMGILPITGIPLPFISYGGSSMLTNMIAIGMCLSVASRRKKHLYLD